MNTLHKAAFSFSEWHEAAAVPGTLAQNWTNARPLNISPSIQQGDGRGKQKLFSIFDVYLLACLSLLKKQGHSTKLLSRVVDFLSLGFEGQPHPREYFLSRDWFVLSATKLTFSSSKTRKKGANFVPYPLQLNSFHDDYGVQIAINMQKLRADIDPRALRIVDSRIARG
jgi:hypothetical protein